MTDELLSKLRSCKKNTLTTVNGLLPCLRIDCLRSTISGRAGEFLSLATFFFSKAAKTN